MTLYCERGGLLEFSVRPGDSVAAGKRLGRVRDVYGRVIEELVSPEAGFVLMLQPTAAVWSGGAYAELAVGDE
jgi:predicted deacylase